MKLHVLQEHINHGQRFDFHHCPIALAVKDKYNLIDTAEVCVTGKHISVFTANTIKKWSLPKIARHFITKFDKRNIVKPLSFETRKARCQ